MRATAALLPGRRGRGAAAIPANTPRKRINADDEEEEKDVTEADDADPPKKQSKGAKKRIPEPEDQDEEQEEQDPEPEPESGQEDKDQESEPEQNTEQVAESAEEADGQAESEAEAELQLDQDGNGGEVGFNDDDMLKHPVVKVPPKETKAKADKKSKGKAVVSVAKSKPTPKAMPEPKAKLTPKPDSKTKGKTPPASQVERKKASTEAEAEAEVEVEATAEQSKELPKTSTKSLSKQKSVQQSLPQIQTKPVIQPKAKSKTASKIQIPTKRKDEVFSDAEDDHVMQVGQNVQPSEEAPEQESVSDEKITEAGTGADDDADAEGDASTEAGVGAGAGADATEADMDLDQDSKPAPASGLDIPSLLYPDVDDEEPITESELDDTPKSKSKSKSRARSKAKDKPKSKSKSKSKVQFSRSKRKPSQDDEQSTGDVSDSGTTTPSTKSRSRKRARVSDRKGSENDNENSEGEEEQEEEPSKVVNMNIDAKMADLIIVALAKCQQTPDNEFLKSVSTLEELADQKKKAYESRVQEDVSAASGAVVAVPFVLNPLHSARIFTRSCSLGYSINQAPMPRTIQVYYSMMDINIKNGGVKDISRNRLPSLIQGLGGRIRMNLTDSLDVGTKVAFDKSDIPLKWSVMHPNPVAWKRWRSDRLLHMLFAGYMVVDHKEMPMVPVLTDMTTLKNHAWCVLMESAFPGTHMFRYMRIGDAKSQQLLFNKSLRQKLPKDPERLGDWDPQSDESFNWFKTRIMEMPDAKMKHPYGTVAGSQDVITATLKNFVQKSQNAKSYNEIWDKFSAACMEGAARGCPLSGITANTTALDVLLYMNGPGNPYWIAYMSSLYQNINEFITLKEEAAAYIQQKAKGSQSFDLDFVFRAVETDMAISADVRGGGLGEKPPALNRKTSSPTAMAISSNGFGSAASPPSPASVASLSSSSSSFSFPPSGLVGEHPSKYLSQAVYSNPRGIILRPGGCPSDSRIGKPFVSVPSRWTTLVDVVTLFDVLSQRTQPLTPEEKDSVKLKVYHVQSHIALHIDQTTAPKPSKSMSSSSTSSGSDLPFAGALEFTTGDPCYGFFWARVCHPHTGIFPEVVHRTNDKGDKMNSQPGNRSGKPYPSLQMALADTRSLVWSLEKKMDAIMDVVSTVASFVTEALWYNHSLTEEQYTWLLQGAVAGSGSKEPVEIEARKLARCIVDCINMLRKYRFLWPMTMPTLVTRVTPRLHEKSAECWWATTPCRYAKNNLQSGATLFLDNTQHPGNKQLEKKWCHHHLFDAAVRHQQVKQGYMGTPHLDSQWLSSAYYSEADSSTNPITPSILDLNAADLVLRSMHGPHGPKLFPSKIPAVFAQFGAVPSSGYMSIFDPRANHVLHEITKASLSLVPWVNSRNMILAENKEWALPAMPKPYFSGNTVPCMLDLLWPPESAPMSIKAARKRDAANKKKKPSGSTEEKEEKEDKDQEEDGVTVNKKKDDKKKPKKKKSSTETALESDQGPQKKKRKTNQKAVEKEDEKEEKEEKDEHEIVMSSSSKMSNPESKLQPVKAKQKTQSDELGEEKEEKEQEEQENVQSSNVSKSKPMKAKQNVALDESKEEKEEKAVNLKTETKAKPGKAKQKADSEESKEEKEEKVTNPKTEIKATRGKEKQKADPDESKVEKEEKVMNPKTKQGKTNQKLVSDEFKEEKDEKVTNPKTETKAKPGKAKQKADPDESKEEKEEKVTNLMTEAKAKPGKAKQKADTDELKDKKEEKAANLKTKQGTTTQKLVSDESTEEKEEKAANPKTKQGKTKQKADPDESKDEKEEKVANQQIEVKAKPGKTKPTADPDESKEKKEDKEKEKEKEEKKVTQTSKASHTDSRSQKSKANANIEALQVDIKEEKENNPAQNLLTKHGAKQKETVPHIDATPETKKMPQPLQHDNKLKPKGKEPPLLEDKNERQGLQQSQARDLGKSLPSVSKENKDLKKTGIMQVKTPAQNPEQLATPLTGAVPKKDSEETPSGENKIQLESSEKKSPNKKEKLGASPSSSTAAVKSAATVPSLPLQHDKKTSPVVVPSDDKKGVPSVSSSSSIKSKTIPDQAPAQADPISEEEEEEEELAHGGPSVQNGDHENSVHVAPKASASLPVESSPKKKSSGMASASDPNERLNLLVKKAPAKAVADLHSAASSFQKEQMKPDEKTPKEKIPKSATTDVSAHAAATKMSEPPLRASVVLSSHPSLAQGVDESKLLSSSSSSSNSNGMDNQDKDKNVNNDKNEQSGASSISTADEEAYMNDLFGAS